jgi:hypothetical protein
MGLKELPFVQVGEKKNICGAEEILEISIHDLRDQIINP